MLEVLKRCFSVNLNEYENINIDLEINIVVLITAVIFAAFIVVFNIYRGNTRLVISQLLRHGAKNEQSAKKLSEIGLEKSKAVRFLLTGDTLLTKIVARVGEKRYTAEKYKKLSESEKKDVVDFSSATFYVRENQTERARIICEKYSTSITNTVIACVLVGMVAISVIACMPGILNVINNMLERVKM